MRKVRQRFEQHRALALGGIQLELQLLDLLAALLAGLEQVRRVLPLTLRARHLIARRVLLALQAFDLRDQAAAMRFGGGQLLQLGRDVEAAVRHAGLNRFEVVADENGIKHRNLRTILVE